MPKKWPTLKWICNAASIKVSNPYLTITEAICSTGRFSKEECKHRGLQMAVQRYCNNITSTETPPAYIAHPTANSNNESVASSLTPSTSTLFQPSTPNFSAKCFNIKRSTHFISTKIKKEFQIASWSKGNSKNIIANSATQSQQQEKNDAKKKALKEATVLYVASRQNGKKHKGAGKIAEAVNSVYGTSISGHMVMQYVANGMVGESPLKMGPDGGIQNDMFNFLLTVFETCVRMKQINGETNLKTTNLLSKHVNKTMKNLSNTT